MPNLFPYTNTHELNLDWILQVVKDFQSKYTNFDQTIADALEAIEAAKTGSLEDMQTALTNALAAISADQSAAQAAIAEDQATAQSAIASDQSAALLALQAALTAALTSITNEQTSATQIIEQLYNTLPASAQDILGRLNILDNIITGYTPSNAFTWLQGGYIYPEAYDPVPTPPAIYVDDPSYDKLVSSRYMTGCAGQRLRITTDGTVYINHICCWFNTPPGGAPGGFSIGQEGLTHTFGDIIFPLNTTAFSIEFVSPDGTVSITPNDIIGHIDIRWVTDFVDQATIAPKETSNTANVARETGELFFLDGVLYRDLEDIAVGDTIVTSGAGANCEETTIDEELQEKEEAISDLKSAFDRLAYSGINLFNKDTATPHKKLYSGEIIDNPNTALSDFIPANANDVFIAPKNNFAGAVAIGIFNASKTYIGDANPVDAGDYYTYTLGGSPSIAYIRFTTGMNALDTIMLVKGTTYPDTYVPYGSASIRHGIVLSDAMKTETQGMIDTSVGELGNSVEKEISVAVDALSGTDYVGYYLSSVANKKIKSTGATNYHITSYPVVAGNTYAIIGKDVSLTETLPAVAFGTESVANDANYTDAIVIANTTPTDYIVNYIPATNGSIYIAYNITKNRAYVYNTKSIAEIYNAKLNSRKDIKIQLFGDSITDIQNGTKERWVTFIAENMPGYNITIVDDAVDGSGIGHGKSTSTPTHQDVDYNHVHDLVTSGNVLQTDADVIVILIGTNNWSNGTPIGTMESEGTSTIYGSWKGILDYISEHTSAIVFICTPPQRYNTLDQSRPTNDIGEPLNSQNNTLAEYCSAYHVVADYYGMPCIDLNTSLGWNRINIDDYTDDGLHPNTKGRKALAKYICSVIKMHI